MYWYLGNNEKMWCRTYTNREIGLHWNLMIQRENYLQPCLVNADNRGRIYVCFGQVLAVFNNLFLIMTANIFVSVVTDPKYMVRYPVSNHN